MARRSSLLPTRIVYLFLWSLTGHVVTPTDNTTVVIPTDNTVGCGPPPVVLHAVVTVNNTRAYYTCKEGYWTRNTNTTLSLCHEDGNWTSPEFTCVPIDCGPAPQLGLSSQWSSSNSSVTQYQCQSGHVFRLANGRQSLFSINCTILDYRPAWVDMDGYPIDPAASCSPLSYYHGCYSTANVTLTEQSGLYRVDSCRDTCFLQDQPFAALRADKCACMDVFPSNVSDDANCNLTCGGEEDQLCGGHPDLWSVFVTFRGCYTNVSMDGWLETLNAVTCREICRGRDSVYAAYSSSNLQCACLNSTQPWAVRESASVCLDPGLHNDSLPLAIEVVLLGAEVPPRARSCEDLYEKGVYLHGLYYISQLSDTFYCQFYDGSVACEDQWVGFSGNCYLFSKVNQAASFDEAWQQCVQQDALLVSVTSVSERDFLVMTQNSVAAFASEPKYYIGLYDHFSAFAHQWLDGSLRVYTNFEMQSLVSEKCVVYALNSRNAAWSGTPCSHLHGYVCKRSPGVNGCISMPGSGVTPLYTLENAVVMTLTLCFETCRARGAVYSTVSGSTCQCWESLPAHENLTFSECSVPCPGNRFQLCGDSTPSASGQVTAFYVQEAGQLYADSCVALEILGITGSNLTISNNGKISTVDCSPHSGVICPYSWSNLNGRCYRYFREKSQSALSICRDMGGYLAVLDDPEEEHLLFGNTSALMGQTSWRIGLFTHGVGNGLLPRTSNGRAIEGLQLPPSEFEGKSVLYNALAAQGSRVYFSPLESVPFVCEAGPEYSGCGQLPADADLVLDNYSPMTATLCIELCRGRRQTYALLNAFPFRCFCTDTTPVKEPRESLCSNFCFPNHGQACGGTSDDYVSVYNVEHFPVFTNTCSDLFNNGIFFPGIYLIAGQPAFCFLKDNSTCSQANSSWVGVGINGSCFKRSNFDTKGLKTEDWCATLSPLHVPASIRSQQELQLLVSLDSMLKRAFLQKSMHLGGLDQFLMGTFTWADGWLMTWNSSYWMQGFHFYNILEEKQRMVMVSNAPYHFGAVYDSTLNLNVICRELHDDLGCFVNDHSLPATVDNYSSMSIGLCKQRCLASNASVALLDTASCYCAVDTVGLQEPASQPHAGCVQPCPANFMQKCASPGFLRAYAVDVDDVANSCATLYANFILLRDLYMLKDDVTGDLTPTLCGLSDNTSCPAGFLGDRGKCYRLFPRSHVTAETGAERCRAIGAYLTAPVTPDHLAFLTTVIAAIPKLGYLTQWRLGTVFNPGQGPEGVASDGSALMSALWNMTSVNITDVCSVLHADSGDITTRSCNVTLPFICETGQVFQGCYQLTMPVSGAVSFDLTLTSSTVQQCVALCRGQDHRYALLTNVTCVCVNSDVTTTGNVTDCPEGCPDYFTQVCGSDSLGIYAVYDVDAYPDSQTLAESCVQYRRRQVTTRGRYYLQLSAGPKLLVTCGSYGSVHQDVLSEEGALAVYSASSSQEGSPQNVRLQMEMSRWTGWRPKDRNIKPWIQIAFSRIYILKAVVITGNGSGGHVIRLAMLTGLSLNTMTVYNGSFYGPSHGRDLAVVFLSMPVVAKVVRLAPLDGRPFPAVSATFLGQPYASFNYSNLYVGCFADPTNTTLVFLADVPSVEDCKDRCKSQGYPFFGLVEISGTTGCGCSNTIGEYGELDITACNATWGSWPSGSDQAISVAVYRTYDLKCSAPANVTHATGSVTSLVGLPDDVPGVGSVVTYQCHDGYELADNSPNATITCHHDETWSHYPPACQEVQCGVPSDIAHGQVRYTNVTYESVALYTCDRQYQTEDGMGSQLSQCSHKTWTPPAPLCTSPREISQRKASITMHGKQISGASVITVRTRGRIDCARHCMAINECSAYSVCTNTTTLEPQAHNCRLHLDFLSPPDYVLDYHWNVYVFSRGD